MSRRRLDLIVCGTLASLALIVLTQQWQIIRLQAKLVMMWEPSSIQTGPKPLRDARYSVPCLTSPRHQAASQWDMYESEYWRGVEQASRCYERT